METIMVHSTNFELREVKCRRCGRLVKTNIVDDDDVFCNKCDTELKRVGLNREA